MVGFWSALKDFLLVACALLTGKDYGIGKARDSATIAAAAESAKQTDEALETRARVDRLPDTAVSDELHGIYDRRKRKRGSE